ncbi:MAG: hypothetical protein AMJ54_14910 [Deltaproteobacteria bacterium SG8_13]|nr:MAG: hypothetical protein AMJ54_14910 [Deltaproteobacteria bacterium SG8_13]
MSIRERFFFFQPRLRTLEIFDGYSSEKHIDKSDLGHARRHKKFVTQKNVTLVVNGNYVKSLALNFGISNIRTRGNPQACSADASLWADGSPKLVRIKE